MEEERSGSSLGIVVKNRNSSGCLIVRRKGDDMSGGLGSSSSGKPFEAKRAKKRPRMVLSDSGSSDELLNPSYRRVGLETVGVCNDLAAYERGFVEESGICRKNERLVHKWRNEDVILSRNGLHESERKRSKINVFDFNEYNGIDQEMMHGKLYEDSDADFREKRHMGSMHVPRNGFEREYETGSSRHVVDKKINLDFDRKLVFSPEHIPKSRHVINSDRAQLPFPRDKFISHSSESIRLQGKNGVLKVMVNKKKSLCGSREKNSFQKAEKTRRLIRTEDTATKNVRSSPSFYSEAKLLQKPNSVARNENNIKAQQILPTENSKGYDDSESEDSGASMKLEPKNFEACKSNKVSYGGEDALCETVHLNKVKEGKVRRGSGTEKQKLREKIRAMLLDAGWTIDYRPRRNRDYLDAVYINPSGTAYWSIIKAYDALQKQLNDEDNEAKPSGDGSFAPITDDVLSQLTRKTRKKLEKEMKKKQREQRDSENARAVPVKKSTTAKHNINGATYEDKLSSFIKQSGKSFKNRVKENGFAGVKSNGSNHRLYDISEKLPFGSSSHLVCGVKNRKLGRCTLLVRGSSKGLNSETDGFVPYTGKRTLLSWLIDSGSVQLSQKVQYINRRTTQIMLEGWITREGIHCGCCSKVLTIPKFAIHAGSKLRQPYQNIYLDSGISLLQCQIDAWNRLVESEKIGFNYVDIDGDDPNDDACGICGDGGDLICCDSCPSTFHQSCLCIQMLPPGNWHCPNCTCKFCGKASENVGEENVMYDSERFICSLCEKKYHNSCVEDVDITRADSNNLAPCFCGQKCIELFEHLHKYLGVKHDLGAGFSWSLIHRNGEDSDTSNLGVPQKVECNLKLAVAFTIMDECFMPIVDRRSEINLIRNVVYNCGSNFNRLNYSGFYTVVLERGDEVISAASIRFHGTKLAEMPFIGTRHIYRRQGMCRRLFGAIESVLCSLKVEKLIIPAISELMHTWTTVFSFAPLEKSLKREMSSMNMLVFPGIDMLQKLILVQEVPNTATNTGMRQHFKPEMEVENDADSSAMRNLHGDGQLCLANEATKEAAVVDSDSQSLGVTLNDTSVVSGSLEASEHENPHSTEETLYLDSHSEAKFIETSCNVLNKENKPVQDSCLKDNEHCTAQFQDASLIDNTMSGSLDASNELKVQVSSEGTTFSDSRSGAQYISERKCLSPPGTSHVHSEDIRLLEFNSKYNSRSLEEDDMDDSLEMNAKYGSHEKGPASIFAGNTTGEDNEKIDNSISCVTGKESSLLLKSDLVKQTGFAAGNKSKMVPKAASDGMIHVESFFHGSSNRSCACAHEGKTEPGFI